MYSLNDVDRLLDEGLKTTDPKARAEIYRNVQETIWKDVPWGWLVFEDVTSAKRTSLKNFRVLPNNEYDFYEAYVERK